METKVKIKVLILQKKDMTERSGVIKKIYEAGIVLVKYKGHYDVFKNQETNNFKPKEIEEIKYMKNSNDYIVEEIEI